VVTATICSLSEWLMESITLCLLSIPYWRRYQIDTKENKTTIMHYNDYEFSIKSWCRLATTWADSTNHR
jgi:hypothetical protein